MNNPNQDIATQYLRRQIEGASPAQQLVMLFDGAIKFTLQAKDAILRGDIQERYNTNRRAMEIIGYLLEILDVEKAGEVGPQLRRIYTFLLKKHMQVDFRNDPALCDEILEHLRILRNAWNQLAEQGAQPGQSAVAASPAVSAPVVPPAPVLPMQRPGASNPYDIDPLPVFRNIVA